MGNICWKTSHWCRISTKALCCSLKLFAIWMVLFANSTTKLWHLISPFMWFINRFWPLDFGWPISESEQHLFSLPACLGGMGICDPVDMIKIILCDIKGMYKDGHEFHLILWWVVTVHKSTRLKLRAPWICVFCKTWSRAGFLGWWYKTCSPVGNWWKNICMAYCYANCKHLSCWI